MIRGMLMGVWVVMSVACGATPAAPADEAGSWRTETVGLVRTFEDCDPDAEGCSVVRMRYPRILAGPTPWAVDGLQAMILDIVGQPPFEGAVASPEAVAESFLDAVAETRREFPDDHIPWVLERVVTVSGAAGDAVALRTDEYVHTGGAHPNSFRSYRVAALADGRTITLGDLFDEAGMTSLRAWAERAFRSAHGLSPDASLEEAGFWFEGGSFTLPDNWGFEGDELVLYYNAYDVAPYALGPTELRLPGEQLQAMARPGAIGGGAAR